MWAQENIPNLMDKQVLMYCTGGIRCERASALVRSLGHNNVFQLKGGIHKYLEAFPEGSDSQWSGKNYTFDKRFTLIKPPEILSLTDLLMVQPKIKMDSIPTNKKKGVMMKMMIKINLSKLWLKLKKEK
jgi:predicted sulfurtransferase